MTEKIKIPQIITVGARCPLCYAEFDRRESPARREHILKMIQDANAKYAAAKEAKNQQKMKDVQLWGETLEASLKAGAAQYFLCHFCRISIACNDPFVGRWEEAYAKGEKIFCPACDSEMRYFATSTGYMLAQCPAKKCRSRMELSAPDRTQEETPQLFDAAGEPIALPGVDRAISTPDAPALTQVMGDGKDAGLPGEVTIPKELLQ